MARGLLSTSIQPGQDEPLHAVPSGHGNGAHGAPVDGPRVIGWMEITDGDRREWKPVFETPVGEKQGS